MLSIFFIPLLLILLEDMMLLKFQAKQQFWRSKQKVTRKSLAIYYAWTGKTENFPFNVLLHSHSSSN